MEENEQSDEYYAMSAGTKSYRKNTGDLGILISNNQSDIAKLKSSMKKKCSQSVFMGVIMVVLVIFAAFLVYQLYGKNQSKENDDGEKTGTQSIRSQNMVMAEPLRGSVLKDTTSDIGCKIPSRLTRSFPDIDYVFLGYDILKGFPQADQHDPGFTFSIFKADYKTGSYTADCRYRVPRGLQIIPDVSCDTSFTSRIIRNQEDLASSLSTSAEVSGGGWGVKFSASIGYKKSSRSMGKGEFVYVTSQANCYYYYSRLIEDNPPPFDPTFLSWVHKLNSNDSLETYIEFFSLFGTHYITDARFGARFVKNYKMETKVYEKQESEGVNVAVSASYSGLFSVGGGFSLDSSQQQAASSFMSKVTSETISVGAPPPANGDAMTWASTVKENPIPSGYKLSSIENLFTARYMSHISVDYKLIFENIKRHKTQYCNDLKAIGKVDSCVSLSSALNIKKTKLQGQFDTIKNTPLESCEENCLKRSECQAITYCIKCKTDDSDYRKCNLFSEIISPISAVKHDDYQSTIYRNTIMENTAIHGQALQPRNATLKLAHLGQCTKFIKNEPKAVAFTYNQRGSTKCQLYEWQDIIELNHKSHSSSSFVLHV
ncbi:unnamed protein product [Mytilus coruscus]|uniref:MACPF domain-containing protein n=1 Tax=Mytilus coruscus TaxID=42192 RepID=A0A6J8CUE7_MYTCO|nr:unnamed protein product [Mytilus coruscus]